jgi:hypothetical protein
VKRGSLSDMIDLGKLCNRTTSLKNTFASSGAEIDVVIGAKWDILLSQSTKTTIASILSVEIGSCVIRSIDIDSQLRVGI